MERPNSLSGRALLAPVVFVAWTLFVWGGRIRNLAQEPGPIAEASRWSLVGSVLFCGLGLTLLAALVVDRFGSGRRPFRAVRLAVAALAVFTTGVWVVRGVDIALGDHSVGFIVVHLVLAVVSIGLAIASLLAVRPGSAEGSDGGGPATGRLPSKRWVSL